jgi:hypothetical protein
MHFGNPSIGFASVINFRCAKKSVTLSPLPAMWRMSYAI